MGPAAGEVPGTPDHRGPWHRFGGLGGGIVLWLGDGGVTGALPRGELLEAECVALGQGVDGCGVVCGRGRALVEDLARDGCDVIQGLLCDRERQVPRISVGRSGRGEKHARWLIALARRRGLCVPQACDGRKIRCGMLD